MPWKVIEQQYGKPIGIEQRDIWYTWEELEPLPEMLELVEQLKVKGYVVGLISNVLPATTQLIRDNGGYDPFDFLVLSCEVGARKPEPKIYRAALAGMKDTTPDEVIFLDDREACVAGAEKLGITAIHVTDHAKAIETVRTLAGIA